MSYIQAVPILPSGNLRVTEQFFVLLCFSRTSLSESQLRICCNDVELRFVHLPDHGRIEGTGFTNRTTVLRVRDAKAVRKLFKASGIAWSGWTPPHLGMMEKREKGLCFAFSDPDGNLYWVEEAGHRCPG